MTARTRVLALLGDPVAHAVSPVLHNAALAAAACDAVYVALRCDGRDVAVVMRALAAAGGGGNVTIPHKHAAAVALDHATAAAQRTGACNTFWQEGRRLCGDNTDVHGFAAAARAVFGDLAGASVLLLGAGGAAAAAASVLLDAGAAVAVRSRTASRAAELCARLDPSGRRMRCAGPDVAEADFVVNATPLGMHADDALPPLPARCRAALDLVYRAGETPWVHEARRRGMTAADGRIMLLHQAAAAFEHWWGTPAPVAVMQAALEEALCGDAASARSGDVAP